MAWRAGYSALLGPVTGIVMADYFIVRGRTMDIDSLYRSGKDSIYWYKNGWNPAAIWAMIAGVLPSMPGFLSQCGVLSNVPQLFLSMYDLAWFVGVAVSTVVYCVLMRGAPGAYSAYGAGTGGDGSTGSSPQPAPA